MATPKTSKTKPEARTKRYCKELKLYASRNAKYTQTIKHGSDKNKVNQAGEAITRGENTYVARQCSSHIRTVFPQSILQDGGSDEFCVNGRTNDCPENECKLCGIENDQKWQQTERINIAQAVGGELKDMLFNLGSNYPNANNYTKLVVKKNGTVIIEYYIKLIPFSQLIKSSAPSGYKYKDRSSLSKFFKIQSNTHRDVIFCISSDEVHSVGFWNLLKDGGVRKLIQLHQEKALDACFYLLIDKYSTDAPRIDVELIINRKLNGMTNVVKSLWTNYDDSKSTNSGNSISNGSCYNYGASTTHVTSVGNIRHTPYPSTQHPNNSVNLNYGMPSPCGYNCTHYQLPQHSFPQQTQQNGYVAPNVPPTLPLHYRQYAQNNGMPPVGINYPFPQQQYTPSPPQMQPYQCNGSAPDQYPPMHVTNISPVSPSPMPMFPMPMFMTPYGNDLFSSDPFNLDIQ